MIWMALIVTVIILVSAVATVMFTHPIGAVAAISVVSLGVSVLFAIMRAPDVAMTQATIGAGLGGIVLALGLRRLGLWRLEGDTGAMHPLVPTSQARRGEEERSDDA